MSFAELVSSKDCLDAAYEPLSKIKPSRSSARCCGCSYSLDGIVPVTSAVKASVGSMTVSGVGLSAGKAVDSGTMSLSGVVAWLGDSGSLFMDLSGVF
ncbi:hypothetical protein F2Q70_00002159 [Brassica cretica]|uniref:Uncharacterized protein n=1 Tax=Brassica cretica TaxID=69181 RepID=A0A8S9IVV5_BRACR|nr:hypothetical protein F2Q70_00002159 [Brassica cretica]